MNAVPKKMNNTSPKNGILLNCDKCDKSYKRLYHLNVHNRVIHGVIIENVQTNAPKRTIKRKKKKATKKYCIICCKAYSTMGSYKYHMKRYHDGIDINEQLKGQEPFTWNKKSSKTTNIVSSIDVLKHFENEIPQEKAHSETSDTSDSSEVSFMRLEIKNNGSDTNPEISYDIVCELTCNTCLSKFKSVSKHEEHERICANNMAKDFESLKLCQPKFTNVDEMKADESDKSYNDSPKDDGVPSKAHLKALFEFQINQRKIDCEICGKSCDQLKHLEYHQWWNSS